MLINKNITLYNYMPLKYLSSLLNRGLYFRLASKFEDRNEGYFPKDKLALMKGDIEKITSEFAKAKAPFSLDIPPDIVDAVTDCVYALLNSKKENVFVSCWHENDSLSKKMWNKYVGEHGIYVKTSAWSIQDALPDSAGKIMQFNGSKPNPFFTKIEYVEDLDKIEDVSAKNSIKSLIVHSRKFKPDWEFENEQRLMIDAARFSVLTGIPLNGARVVEGLGQPPIDVSGQIFLEDEFGVVVGISVRIDPLVVVDEIGVLSEESYDEVFRLCQGCGIDEAKIRRLKESDVHV